MHLYIWLYIETWDIYDDHHAGDIVYLKFKNVVYVQYNKFD